MKHTTMTEPVTPTIDRLRTVLEEMFGPERAAALQSTDKPWHDHIQATSLDMIDFQYFVQERFNIQPHAFFVNQSSLQEIADYIDAMTPNPYPH